MLQLLIKVVFGVALLLLVYFYVIYVIFKRKPIVVAIEGIIGAGKTTLISVLYEELTKRGYSVTVVKEPVNKWESSGILKLFYEDASRWAYQFQTMAFLDRVIENRNMAEQNKGTDIFILERSPLTDKLFMEVLYSSQTITDLEYANYQTWWKLWNEIMPYSINLFIYLRPDVDVCMDRVKERSRNGESKVTKNYQEKLLDVHDLYLTNPVKMGKGKYIPSVTMKTNANFRDDAKIKISITDEFINLILSNSTGT
jgi:deoxyadenosine/deoxycytidine kinase